MGAFHYKAVLLSAEADGWVYRFFPDYFREDESGRLLVRPAGWDAIVIEQVKDASGVSVAYAARCIPALVHKIRRAYEADARPPTTVTHTA
jgi:hypothetical protein